MLQDYKDFAEYIIKNYSHARKIVEIGVGKEFSVCEELRRNLKGTEILVTDIKAGNGITGDDAFTPRMEVYANADLIYSIRPPPELYEYIEKIAGKAGADLIIRPLSTDFVKPRNATAVAGRKSSALPQGTWAHTPASSRNLAYARLVNYGKASFYFIKNV